MLTALNTFAPKHQFNAANYVTQPQPCPNRHKTGKRKTALLRNIKPYYSGTYCKVKCTIHGSKVRPHMGRPNLKLWQHSRTYRVFHIEERESKWLWERLKILLIFLLRHLHEGWAFVFHHLIFNSLMSLIPLQPLQLQTFAPKSVKERESNVT